MFAGRSFIKIRAGRGSGPIASPVEHLADSTGRRLDLVLFTSSEVPLADDQLGSLLSKSWHCQQCHNDVTCGLAGRDWLGRRLWRSRGRQCPLDDLSRALLRLCQQTQGANQVSQDPPRPGCCVSLNESWLGWWQCVLASNTGKWNWAIIWWLEALTFHENRSYVGQFPISWKGTAMGWNIEDKNEKQEGNAQMSHKKLW